MSRSLAFVLIALSLFGRIIAPIAAEARIFDPLADAIICTHDGSTPAQDPLGEKSNHAAHALCAFTCCQVAPGFLTPVVDFRPIARDVTYLAYDPATTAIIVATLAAAHRARGPPHS